MGLSASSASTMSPALSPSFHRLSVAQVIADTAESAVIRLLVPNALRDTFVFRPGQHLTIRKPDEDGEHRRSYSICNQPGEDVLAIGVKRVPGGIVSPWLLSLQPGDELEALHPHGSFVIDFASSQKRHYVAIAGGSGITPILALLSHALAEEPESRATLLYGNRDARSTMLLDALLGLKDRYLDRFALHLVYEQELGSLPAHAGPIGDADLAALGRVHGFPREAGERYLVCGPGVMTAKILDGLARLGVRSDAINAEFFNAPASKGAARPLRVSSTPTASLVAVLDGRRWPLAYRPEMGSILEGMLSVNIPAPFACRTAVCGACKGKVITGRAAMRRNYALHKDDVERGYILACQAYPETEDVVIDFDG